MVKVMNKACQYQQTAILAAQSRARRQQAMTTCAKWPAW